jgi:transcriptional regulator with XRE-family HTH domain/tetratricopeptide (TPR) repeat protein
MYACQIKWSSGRNVRSKQENTFDACGQEKAMLPVGSMEVNAGLAHRWELRSIDPSSPAIRRLGDTLYNLRIQAGLTQEQLAVRTGGRWSRSHIGRVENGDVTPSPDFVEAMDGLLGGGHSLMRCLPPLLLETARHRSRRQRLRRDPEAASHCVSQSAEKFDRSALYTSPGTTAHDQPTTPPATISTAESPIPQTPSPKAPVANLPPTAPRVPGPPAPNRTARSLRTPPDAFAPPPAAPKDQESRSTANRSDFLRVSVWAGLGAVLESVRLTLRVEGPAGGPVSHEQLELAVEQYARAYWSTPAGVLFGQVRQCRQLAEGMLDERQPTGSRRHLHLVAGWLSALLGNLSFHLSDYSAARTHLATAGRLGQEAGHNGLVAWVRGAQSMVELYDDRPEAALRLAREGQALAPNPLVRAQLASWGEARALARMGERRGVLEAIARGSRAIESSDGDRSPGGVFSFSVGEFEQYCGTACLWLDLPDEAKRHAGHAFQLRDTIAAKALARLDIATASSQLGDPAEAGQIGAEVLQMPAEYLIDPIVRRATELATSLRRHGSFAEVRDFNERLAALVAASRHPRAARSAAER